jgi:hypothetical protein
MTMTLNLEVLLPSQELVFAGDEVRLAGQLTIPLSHANRPGSPTLRFASCLWQHHDDYAAYAEIGLDSGYAVFRG